MKKLIVLFLALTMLITLCSCTKGSEKTDAAEVQNTAVAPDLAGVWHAELPWLEFITAASGYTEAPQAYERMDIDTSVSFILEFDDKGNAEFKVDRESLSDFVEISTTRMAEYSCSPEYIEDQYSMSVDEFEGMIASEGMTLESYGELVSASFTNMVSEAFDNADTSFTYSIDKDVITTTPDTVELTVTGDSVTYSNSTLPCELVFVKNN